MNSGSGSHGFWLIADFHADPKGMKKLQKVHSNEQHGGNVLGEGYLKTNNNYG